MNELEVRQANLPTMPMEDVKKCVDVIGDAIDALKAKRSAASHMNVDKTILDEMDRQIREYSAVKVQAQVELGKRTAEMEVSKGGDSTLFRPSEERQVEKTKKSQLANLGLTSQRANEYEKMAHNEEAVNRYIEESLANGKAPTKNGALAEIKKVESYISEDDMEKEKKKWTNPGGFTKERREQRNLIDAIYEDMKSTAESKYDADAFLEELNCVVDSFVSSFKSTIVHHSTMLDENIREQIRTISSTVLPKLDKEVLKNL